MSSDPRDPADGSPPSHLWLRRAPHHVSTLRPEIRAHEEASPSNRSRGRAESLVVRRQKRMGSSPMTARRRRRSLELQCSMRGRARAWPGPYTRRRQSGDCSVRPTAKSVPPYGRKQAAAAIAPRSRERSEERRDRIEHRPGPIRGPDLVSERREGHGPAGAGSACWALRERRTRYACAGPWQFSFRIGFRLDRRPPRRAWNVACRLADGPERALATWAGRPG